jgi:hypothetical protein
VINWLQAKGDLDDLLAYRDALVQLWQLEDMAPSPESEWRYISRSERQQMVQQDATMMSPDKYQIARAQVARTVLKAEGVAARLGVPIMVVSLPPPAVGGYKITASLFSTPLRDPTHGGVDRQSVVDAVNQAIGAAEDQVKTEFRRLLNPFNWIWSLLSFVLSIPFRLIDATGFDADKVEEHVLGKGLKLAELLLILYLVSKTHMGVKGVDFLLKALKP